MSEPTVKYKRLPGRGRRAQGVLTFSSAHSSLWLGPDHLLSLDRIWMNEEYKRFYFRDIQSITVEKTKRALVSSVALGVSTVGAGLTFFALFERSDSTETRTAWLILGGVIVGILLIAFVLNLLRGPSCVCRLRTAVQTEVLPSLGRLRAARKALAILQPLIEQTQGMLEAAELKELPSERAEAPQSAALPHPVTGRPPPRPARRESGYVHLAFYIVLLLDAADGLYSIANPAWHLYEPLAAALLLAPIALSIAALVRQRETSLPPGLQNTTTVSFIAMAIMDLVFIVYLTISRMTYSMAHPGVVTEQSSIDFMGMPGFKQFAAVANFVEFGLGAAGLVMTVSYLMNRGREKPPSVAEEGQEAE